MTDAATIAAEPLLLDQQQAADFLGVPFSAVRELHRTKMLRGIVVARRLRWPRARLEQFASELAARAKREELKG